jgi:ferritin
MKEKIQVAINDQIKAEFDSAYAYLAMAAAMEARNLKGFGQWLRVQWEEEVVHAMKLYDFVLQRGGEVELHALSKPDIGSTHPKKLFERVLAMEQSNTRRIHDLYDLAVKESDYALQTILHWYIDEQVEEEDIVDDILEKLKLIGYSGPNLFLLDQEMGQRQREDKGE